MAFGKFKVSARSTLIAFLIFLLLIIFSPHVISWISEAFTSIVREQRFQVIWHNEAELISALPDLQFQVTNEIDTQLFENAFFIEPNISGTWTWAGDDFVVWQANQAFPVGEMIHFGFKDKIGSTGSDINFMPNEWRVFVRETEIAALKSINGGKEVFIISIQNPTVEKQLTFTGGNVIDLAVSTSGDRIIFSQLNDQSGADLWSMNRDGDNPTMIYECGALRCTSIDWHPNQNIIVFVIEEVASQNHSSAINPAKPVMLNLGTGQLRAVFKDPERIGYDPLWSSRGQWLSVWNGVESGISVVHTESQELGFLDSSSEDTGCWSPDDRYFYYSRVREEGLPIVSNIYQVDILSGRSNLYITNELFDLGYNYYYPVCHPMGEGLMVAVQIDFKVPQRDLWWIFPDGSYKVIFNDLSQLVTQFSWSPDGNTVLFLSDILAGLSNGSRVGVWDEESGLSLINGLDDVFKVIWLP